MIDPIARLGEAGVFGPVDVHFTRTLAGLEPKAAPEILLGAAFASRAISVGHVCADLRRIHDRPLVDREGVRIDDVVVPSVFEWAMKLGEGRSKLVGDGRVPTPLVFDGGARVYLYRYWRYQDRLATALRRRAAAEHAIDPVWLRSELDRLFVDAGGITADACQREAAAVAALRGLTVLSGGPGTGKTTTVVRLLALLQGLALRETGTPLRVSLLAPTGKAAARLEETIAGHVETLSCSAEVRTAMPRHAQTIHRALGFRPGTPTRFFHGPDMPLPVDLVLVDEASMVDLALMSKLFDAVPDTARVVLVGDKDQLASVEAGAILGDVCNAAGGGASGRSPAFAARLGAVLPRPPAVASPSPAIGDCLVELVKNYRFDETSGIGTLAAAIKAGRRDDARARLVAAERGEIDDLALVPIDDPEQLPTVLRGSVVAGYGRYLRAETAHERLARLGEFRLLSAHRGGPFGVERLNDLCEQLLADAGLIDPNGPWYDGRPILVTANDYQLQLFNGDVGVLMQDEHGRLRACFPGATAGELRWISPARLPTVESVFAMTVHKSQGSEFDEIGLVVPGKASAILTRELLYTGLTRARRRAVVYGKADVVLEAIAARIDRASGLREALWESSDR